MEFFGFQEKVLKERIFKDVALIEVVFEEMTFVEDGVQELVIQCEYSEINKAKHLPSKPSSQV